MSLEDLKQNAAGYVFNGSMLEAPYISVDIYTVTAEALDSAVAVYLGEADEYASSFTDSISIREYVVDRLQKDLAGECEGLTSGGINKEENNIVMHVKADDVYAVASKNKSISDRDSIASIMDTYGTLHSAICMNDENTDTSLQQIYVEAEDYTYDTKAITVEFAEESRLFINDKPGYVGNTRTFTAYDTTVDENDVYVNTPAYTIGYYEDISVNESTTVSAWFIRDAGNIAVAYSETLEGPYTLIGEDDSSSSGESGEEPSESSEEPSEEPSESSEEPSEEPSETESSESESSEEP